MTPAPTPKPHFSLLATSFAGGPRPRRAATIIAGLWLLLFFAALFFPPILDDADGTHAQAARAMATTGDLITLKVDGIRYLEKAPLPYWLVALSFRVFGFNTFAAHLPQALAVLLLALLGHRWANQAFGSRTGFYTAIAILTSAGVFLFTRIFIPEVLLSLLLATALFAFLKALSPGVPHPQLDRSEAKEEFRVGSLPGLPPERPAEIPYAGTPFYAYAMWSALALAVLTKGLVALVFFFATTLLFLILTGTVRDIRRLRPLTGLALFLLIAAPWHVLAGLKNTGGANGHGFFWFYFWNEHVLRFLGQRIPKDYNKLPGWLYWTQHLVWLFPWALFLPLSVAALWRRDRHQRILTAPAYSDASYYLPRAKRWSLTPYEFSYLYSLLFTVAASRVLFVSKSSEFTSVIIAGVLLSFLVQVMYRRKFAGLEASPFHRIDPQQRTILLLSLFAAIVLLFFSLSTNQEYYTFPAYLPLLLLVSATITRAEQTYSSDPSARRWITFAHAAFTALGLLFAAALCYGLWSARHLPFVPDIGDLLAHRGVGDYTLSMSHVFDLTGESFAALRLPAALAAVAFAFGPALAWALRMQRRHLAATTTIAFTAALFLVAAHIAFARFGPMLSSEDLAAKIQELEDDGQVSRQNRVMLFGDQAYGSSVPFYLGQEVELVEGRSSSMLFGSTFPDAPPVFLESDQLVREWGKGERILLFIPLEKRDEVDRLLGKRQILIEETSGKALITDRPLEEKQTKD